MQEWLLGAKLHHLAEEELPLLRLTRSGRIVEASLGAQELLGPLGPPPHPLKRVLNLTEDELQGLLHAETRWDGRCSLVRSDGLCLDVRLMGVVRSEAHAAPLLLHMQVIPEPLIRMQEELSLLNSQLTNLSRDRAKQASKLARALEENQVQAAELARLNAELIERDRIKSQFYNNMSHDVRAPLNSIIGFTEDALDGVAGPLTPTLQHYLGNVMISSRLLLAIVTDMLDLAKLQSGRASLELEPVDVRALLAELKVVLEPLLKRKGHQLVLDVPEALPMVQADHAKLSQILLNLATNACKYTADGGLVTIALHVDQQRWRFSVSDTGVGIPAGDLAEIFEEFRQVRGRRRTAEHGTGLGLAIVKRLVELHGGTVFAQSEPDQGSTFTVDLPLEVLP